VDLSEFHPVPVHEARDSLGIPRNSTVFVTSGRIGRFKGGEFLLDSFALFQRKCPNSLLFFVGDGEDRPVLEAAIAKRGLDGRVVITGFQKPDEVCCYLNSADAVVFGSLVEGWSVAMLEALACGKPIVSTAVSGVSVMVLPRQNGFVVSARDPQEFASAMENSLTLEDAAQVSLAVAGSFGLTRMGERLSRLWPPLQMTEPAVITSCVLTGKDGPSR
jgi:glycosyltransferase involved in cell wall biosynthesis